MPTKTTCRIGSDVDLLSRVQLEEVVGFIQVHCAKGSVEFVSPAESSLLRDNKSHPNTPARIAQLMNGLVENEYDALVLDAAATPPRLPSGTVIAAITPRITPYDALICSKETILDELAENAVLAATGARREAQMRYYRPDLKIVHTKGSVDSLIQKVNGVNIDAAVVAAADMERLGRQEIVVELLTNSVCVPAAGQGALAVLVRTGEDTYIECLRSINDAVSYRELSAEWTFLNHLGLSESDPVGVLAASEGNVLEIEGVLAYPDGREKIRFVVKGSPGQEVDLGRTLAEEILEAGGREILQELHLI